MATEKLFDLEERTAKFGERVLQFVKKIEPDHITRPLVTQLVKSATSIGANYCEADNAESREDFKHKMSIAKKEAKETMHWLRMIATAVPDKKDPARILWKEKQRNLILLPIPLPEKLSPKRASKKPELDMA